VVSGRVTTVAELCLREKCSVRQVNMTISLAFLAPNLVKAAVEGRLPRGVGITARLPFRVDQSSLNYRGAKRGITAASADGFRAEAGRRERNFWMRRQGAKNRRQSG
jgi:hypothetical protein